VLLEAGAGRLQDLVTPGLAALVGDPGHEPTLAQKEGTFPLDVGRGLVTVKKNVPSLPPAERTRAVGVWAAVAGGSAVLGLLGTGILLEWFSWRAGLVALVFSIIEAPDAGWLSARTLGGMAAGLVALAGFVLWELRQRHPLLDPRLFASRKLSSGSLSILIQFFAFFVFTFVSLQYLQGVRGYSPLVAALAVLPLSCTMMPAARVTSALVTRFGSRAVYGSSLHLAGVPASLADQARQSFAVAIHAGGPVGAGARVAFVDGIHAGLLCAAGAALLAAVTVRRRPALPRRGQRSRPGASRTGGRLRPPATRLFSGQEARQ
jgi:hypothetical protein